MNASRQIFPGMRFSALFVRFRYWLLALIGVLGFWSPWQRMGSAHRDAHLGTTWLYLASALARSRILPIAYSSTAVMGVAILLATLSALLRTWAAAYRDRGSAQDRQRLVCYIGLWLHMLALSVLMPPGGALFAVVLSTAAIGSMFATANRSAMAADGERPGLGRALLQEIYFWGVAITYMVFASRYNVTFVEQGVLVSLGIAVVLQGLLRPAAGAAA